MFIVLGTPTMNVLFSRKNCRSFEFKVQEIFSKNFSNFLNFFKIEKPIILVLKLVQNHHVIQNMAKSYLKTP